MADGDRVGDQRSRVHNRMVHDRRRDEHTAGSGSGDGNGQNAGDDELYACVGNTLGLMYPLATPEEASVMLTSLNMLAVWFVVGVRMIND